MRLTDTQVTILVSNRSVVDKKRPEHILGQGYVSWLIPLYGGGEVRSANAMEKRGYGYVCTCAPYNNAFFRVKRDVYELARNDYRAQFIR